ncbi:MAG: long-chain-fatty-acid--CoA ligase [Desulfobacteraceae bacterium]|nr:MAG: long-chain-fatty-acid--CoA ligase [Desulfobacteraceae bacterium]
MDLGQLVARNARMIPDKEGIIYEDARYTWKTVNEKVNAVSNTLVREGLKKGDKVAIWMQNTDMFVFAFYGIVKAGGVAVPVNFRLAAPEAEYIFKHCDAQALIFDDPFEPLVREMKPRLEKIKVFYSAGNSRFEGFDPLADVMASGDKDEPGVTVDEFDDSEILYTSGTTGRPKGALLQHHSQMTVVTTMSALVGMRPSDRLLHAAPLFHSAELNLYMNPGTYMGCTQTIIKDFIPPKILGLIQQERITQFFGAPIMYTFMMSVPDFEKYDLSSIRYYGYGAAPMAAESVKKMMEKFKTDRFFCLCGFTEAGPGGIALEPEYQLSKAGAGGRYIVNMESRLVDIDGSTITAPGVVGELAVKGETIMKGYYKNPEATAEAIRDGWVYSGDLGVLDAAGFITLVDRKKDMIITGGENVYSKEVEDAIFEHPAIASAVIIGVPHEHWGETVMAVVTLKKETSLSLEELRAFLKPRIADYKVPRMLEVMDALPMNISGKVLKYKLREMFKDAQKQTAKTQH